MKIWMSHNLTPTEKSPEKKYFEYKLNIKQDLDIVLTCGLVTYGLLCPSVENKTNYGNVFFNITNLKISVAQ